MIRKKPIILDAPPRTPKVMRQAIANVLHGDETDDRTEVSYWAYHATLHACFPGRQLNRSAGWLVTVRRVQNACLKSLARRFR